MHQTHFSDDLAGYIVPSLSKTPPRGPKPTREFNRARISHRMKIANINAHGVFRPRPLGQRRKPTVTVALPTDDEEELVFTHQL